MNIEVRTMEDISVPQMRAAANTWRMSAPNKSLHGRIDDLIDEVERLRTLEGTTP